MATNGFNRVPHPEQQTGKIESVIGLRGERIMPEMRFTEFPALSGDPRAGFLDLHRRPMFIIHHFFYIWHFTLHNERHLGVFRGRE